MGVTLVEVQEDNFKALDRYRVEGNRVIIEMTLEEPYDIYDDKDPSPLRMRDFQEEVEDYIVGSLMEIPKNKKVKVVFYFDKFSGDTKEIELLKKSYDDFFKFKIRSKDFQFRQTIKYGLRALAVGMSFLFFCVLMTHILNGDNLSLIQEFILEGLTVLGWVSLWNPVNIFLYELWPIKTEKSLLERAFKAETEFKHLDKMPDDRIYITDD